MADLEDENRAIRNAMKRVEIAKARMNIVNAAETLVEALATKREGEFVQDLIERVKAPLNGLVEAVSKLKELEAPETNDCKHDNRAYSEECGSLVCDDCGSHWGLARCFCGWSASGGDGRKELEEMGETIEEE